jgi:hypothetical protein
MDLYSLMTDKAEVNFHAATDQVAVAVALLVGRGHFGVRRVYADEVVGGWSFHETPSRNISAMSKAFGDVPDLQTWIDGNIEVMISALEDCARMSKSSEIVDYAVKCAAQMRNELATGVVRKA